jgi:hypothetical protein
VSRAIERRLIAAERRLNPPVPVAKVAKVAMRRIQTGERRARSIWCARSGRCHEVTGKWWMGVQNSKKITKMAMPRGVNAKVALGRASRRSNFLLIGTYGLPLKLAEAARRCLWSRWAPADTLSVIMATDDDAALTGCRCCRHRSRAECRQCFSRRAFPP